jgi:glycosyltransferase involved in cell wall biosynthesis
MGLVNPKISVLMSAYNAEKHIEEAVQSILDQSYKDFEFIIINDGSNDNTLEKLRAFADLDNRIRLIDQSNIGLTNSLVKMVELARGKYLARMDADDVSHKERLTLQIQYLEDNLSVGMIGSWVHIIDEVGSIISNKKLVTLDKKIQKKIIYGNQFVHGSVMLRKDIFFLAGGYDDTFKYSQDYDLWLRVSKISKCVNYPFYLYLLRVHKDSLSCKNSDSQLDFAVRSIMKNVCHQRIKYGFKFIGMKCECPMCTGTTFHLNTERIKAIVSARLLLRRGEYKKSAYFYSKIKSIEGYSMALLLRSTTMTHLAKNLYVYLTRTLL